MRRFIRLTFTGSIKEAIPLRHNIRDSWSSLFCNCSVYPDLILSGAYPYHIMQTQEVVTIISKVPQESAGMPDSCIQSYPELNSMFSNGMYVETFNQTMITPDRYMITFVFRPNHTYEQAANQPAL